MLITKASDIKAADITDYTTYVKRRQFLHGASSSVLAAGVAGIVSALLAPGATARPGKSWRGYARVQ